jgi:hypothetical protein
MKKGYERATLLGFKDKENNMPLHAAVNGGNIKVGATTFFSFFLNFGLYFLVL